MAAARDVFIFHKMEPSDGYELLKKSDKKWLIRESRTPGMLSVDCVEPCKKPKCQKSLHTSSYRFALTENGWNAVTGESGEWFNGHKPVTATQTATEYVNQLLQLIKQRYELTESSRLNPKGNEQTVNALYRAYDTHSVALPAGGMRRQWQSGDAKDLAPLFRATTLNVAPLPEGGGGAAAAAASQFPASSARKKDVLAALEAAFLRFTLFPGNMEDRAADADVSLVFLTPPPSPPPANKG